MLFCVTRILTLHQAGIAGEGSVMERRWDQKLLVDPRKDVRSHHQRHYYQSKNEAASLPLLEAQKPTPALIPISPHFENSQQVHLLTVHSKHNFVFCFAHWALLTTVMGASSAADLLCLYVVRWQLDAALNAVPHGNAPGLLAHWAMGEPLRSPDACNLCCETWRMAPWSHRMIGRHNQQKQE